MNRELAKPPAKPAAAAPIGSFRSTPIAVSRCFSWLPPASRLTDVAKLAEKQNLPSAHVWKTIGDQTDAALGHYALGPDQPSFMLLDRRVDGLLVRGPAIEGAGVRSPVRARGSKQAALLCVIGFFLDSYGTNGGTIYIQFIRVLQQIAIGYVIAFVVLPLGWKVQATTAILLLIGHSAEACMLSTWSARPGLPNVVNERTKELAESAGKVDPHWQPADNFGLHLDIRMHEDQRSSWRRLAIPNAETGSPTSSCTAEPRLLQHVQRHLVGGDDPVRLVGELLRLVGERDAEAECAADRRRGRAGGLDWRLSGGGGFPVAVRDARAARQKDLDGVVRDLFRRLGVSGPGLLLCRLRHGGLESGRIRSS